MKRFLKKMMLAWMLAAAMLLSGCSVPQLVVNPEELYRLPELPVKYTELNSLINEILAGGAEYAAPTAGTNIQAVQLVDLDGDRQQEAVAFFREPTAEKPLKIYVFTASGDSYSQTALVEGSGTGIYSIVYNDLDNDGRQELIVGWRVTAEQQVLEVYKYQPGGYESLVRTNCVKYITADMEQDGRQELIVLRANEEGEGIADYYSWHEDGRLASQPPARISVTMAELSQQGQVSSGMLMGGVPALFVTGITGVPLAITDILTVRNGELSNIVLSEAFGVSTEIAIFSTLYPTDINNDGVTEVPRPVQQMQQAGAHQAVAWYQYDMEGDAAECVWTYHVVEDGWYLQMPEAWREEVYAERTTATDEASLTFYIRDSGQPFLRISSFTGSNREVKAVRGNQFLLSRQQETIYTAELLEANETWKHGATADQVREAFSLIVTDWTTG